MLLKHLFVSFSLAIFSNFACCMPDTAEKAVVIKPSQQYLNLSNKHSDDKSKFVVLTDVIPSIITEIRFYSMYNFVGDRINGYMEPCALLTKKAAAALSLVARDVDYEGYILKVYDGYRPQMAVDHFVRWAGDPASHRMKDYFYPDMDKTDIISKGFVTRHSSHSRGSSVDVTLIDKKTGKELDMGSNYDFLDEISGTSGEAELTDNQRNNRTILKEAMAKRGFKSVSAAWWHFTLADEPYPNTYFTFVVSCPLK